MYECMSGQCMSLEDAVKLGKTSLCEMTNKGCYVSEIIQYCLLSSCISRLLVSYIFIQWNDGFSNNDDSACCKNSKKMELEC